VRPLAGPIAAVDKVPLFQFRVGSAATMTITAGLPSTVAIRAKDQRRFDSENDNQDV
jgi:hypothetical protein